MAKWRSDTCKATKPSRNSMLVKSPFILLFILAIGCAQSNQESPDSDHVRQRFEKLHDALESAKQHIVLNHWTKEFDDEWNRNFDRLRPDNEGVLAIEIRKPFIHFELITNALDLNQAFVYVSPGSSIDEYDRVRNHRRVQLADEWYWIQY
jgi:hypothetical protein